MAPLLELVNFQYYYGNIKAVEDVSLYVNEGEMVTIIGANGAGKTTVLQSISGLTDRAGVRGKILLDGKEIQNLRGNKVAALGISQSLEGRHVFSGLSVEENLRMGAYLRNDQAGIKTDMEDVFRRFPRLKERRTQMAGTLSGGEQQMLAMGQCLMQKPKLLLLDEPSMGLAPLIVQEIFEAVVDLNNEGVTILFVEQNSKIALETADRGYVMQTGNIVIEDTCENLLTNEAVQKAYLGAY
jgi:branched-chain amino acid transport system ATP-binding protein